MSKNYRRDWSTEELALLLAQTPYHRSILYKTAAFTGYRKMELRSLTLGHLDLEKCALRLDARDDKGRRTRLQPIPQELARELKAYGESGEALQLYQQYPPREGRKVVEYPQNPLLHVPTYIARKLNEDLERLGIPKRTEEGKLDMHSFRVAYTNLLFKTGTDLKTAQEMARHSDAKLTLITYGRAQNDTKHATIEAAYELVQRRKKVQ